jgi:hypothetical protein
MRRYRRVAALTLPLWLTACAVSRPAPEVVAPLPVVFTYIDDIGRWVQRRLGRGDARSAPVSE